jgi:hypothetical protein
MARRKQPPPIQYRPGPLLGRWLADLASGWWVSENEAARRLAALAACRLDLGLHQQLLQLAGALATPVGEPDFAQACGHLRTALDSANRARQDLGKQPFSQAETLTFITRAIEEAVCRKQEREAEAAQQQTVEVQPDYTR